MKKLFSIFHKAGYLLPKQWLTCESFLSDLYALIVPCKCSCIKTHSVQNKSFCGFVFILKFGEFNLSFKCTWWVYFRFCSFIWLLFYFFFSSCISHDCNPQTLSNSYTLSLSSLRISFNVLCFSFVRLLLIFRIRLTWNHGQPRRTIKRAVRNLKSQNQQKNLKSWWRESRQDAQL